ncbi:MAG: laminin G [Bacteroidetes bacterium HGW-Bacteroidetes-1]|jgi:hypothetical protein|nr:MAG: laminin G [Bacteroidetes bacterium HGW-Bacteroidetes-1]
MKRLILLLNFFLISILSFGQTGQLTISRVDLMPDSPTPLQIRNWKTVTIDYDNYVFDFNKTGEYLPLSRFGTQGQFNYPENVPLFLDSYVGANDHLNQAEAINILPAIIGASLAGIDKSNQNGINWVAKAKDFYNLENGQNVYLNNYSTTSGSDWWYDLMPNVYFYQMRSLYPQATTEFESQFITVADRWLYCVKQLGGSSTPWEVPNMNYRAFNLATGLPLTTGVPEPESAGSIAWLLYNAYIETGERKYFEGAQLSMDFLADFGSNPSYELQLPYGTLAAARLNAVERTNYPIQKFLDWCFNRGDLRGWGTIVGNWGGYDVSGLIGEANDNGNDYAFVMNGFQQVAALAPLPKYDKRYARAIAKFILNISNASRLFYWNALPQAQQDSYNWASFNDPAACIPYESMKEVWQGKSPFATGDALGGGWAATNLSLYSGSSVGYMAAAVNMTNITEILQIDLNKTDFYGENNLDSYMYFNPTPSSKQVQVNLPAGNYSVYEAITESVIYTSISGTFNLSVPAGEVRLIRYFNPGLEPVNSNGRLYVGEDILDYHYQYDYSENLRIKSLSTEQDQLIINSPFTAYCEPGNTSSGDQFYFEWFMNDVLLIGQNQSQVSLTAPSQPTLLELKCRISLNGQTAEDSLQLQVLDRIPVAPTVNGIHVGTAYTVVGESNTFTAIVDPTPGEILQYSWSASTGQLNQNTGSMVTWTAPEYPSVGQINLQVTNQDMLSTSISVGSLVKDTAIAMQTPLIYYPFDSNTKNAVSDNYHATAIGVSKTADARGMPQLAYRFTSGQNIIYTENNETLNFEEAVTISCWVKCEQFESERFIISHGSWQQRYKLSITPEGRLRWTVKTNTGIVDLDSDEPIELNRYYHITAAFTGYSMELYLDGSLNSFKAFSGNILPSNKPLTIGRMDNVETLYSLRGSVDEVKLWDKEISIPQITMLKDQWTTPAGIEESELYVRVYPNPANEVIYIESLTSLQMKSFSLYTMDGRKLTTVQSENQISRVTLKIPGLDSGIYLLQISFLNGERISRKLVIHKIL